MAVAFAPILEAAKARIGAEELAARLPPVRSAADLAAWPDDRYLAQLCLRVFRAGLKHSLVDAKWPAFEEVFHGFVPAAITAMSDEAVEALMQDARLIRHWGKLRSVRDNAAALAAISAAEGGFGPWLAHWPGARITELWTELARRFTQLGGDSAPRFLRMVGKDSFILTPSVTAALIAEGVVSAPPKGKAGLALAQQIFNQWAEETGLPLAHLSVILAATVAE
jgi:3-methyladenine DNA glycosylase Tag